MTRHPAVALGVVTGAVVVGLGAAPAADRRDPPPAPASYGMRVAPLQLQSIGVMAFGPDATLYVADSRAGAVYAIDLGEEGRDTSTTGLRIRGIDAQIAAAVGASVSDIRVRDMVAHPATQSVYLSVTKRDQRVSVVPLDAIRHARVALPDAASRDTTMPWEGVPRSFTMTHLAATDGELFVAGLSNQEFKSTLRRVPLPFGQQVVTTKVEIYHTSHDRFETASPIEAMLPVTLGGRPLVLASYTCSPLVIFERDALRGDGVVRGRTVAELGGGNRPFDMIAYRSPKDGKPYLMIANSDRTLMRFDLDSLAAAPAMTTPVKQAYQPAGIPYLPVAGFGVLQLDAYNARNVIVLRRSAADGSLDLATVGLNWL